MITETATDLIESEIKEKHPELENREKLLNLLQCYRNYNYASTIAILPASINKELDQREQVPCQCEMTNQCAFQIVDSSLTEFPHQRCIKLYIENNKVYYYLKNNKLDNSENHAQYFLENLENLPELHVYVIGQSPAESARGYNIEIQQPRIINKIRDLVIAQGHICNKLPKNSVRVCKAICRELQKRTISNREYLDLLLEIENILNANVKDLNLKEFNQSFLKKKIIPEINRLKIPVNLEKNIQKHYEKKKMIRRVISCFSGKSA